MFVPLTSINRSLLSDIITNLHMFAEHKYHAALYLQNSFSFLHLKPTEGIQILMVFYYVFIPYFLYVSRNKVNRSTTHD